MVLEFTAEALAPRMDKYLTQLMPGYSRSFFQKLMSEGDVRIDGKAASPAEKPRAGAVICVTLPDEAQQEDQVAAEQIPLDIVYEDDVMLVVNKPKGMVTHPAPGSMTGTLVNALLGYGIPLSTCNEDPLRPGIVHRLDKDTTGLLVEAKTDAAHVHLAEQIREKRAHRIYTALCVGNVKADSGTIDLPMGRHPKDRKKMAVVPGGREARTDYTVLARYGGYTLVQASLHTGRTHQIRVHFAKRGFPVVGDPLYCGHKSPFATQGQVLHAGRLELTHPVSGQPMTFTAPLPEYFEKILSKLEARRIE